jgi:hypothetical protein
VVAAAVGWGVVAFADGSAVVGTGVCERDVVVRTVGEVPVREVEVSATMPATVGGVWTAGAEEALTRGADKVPAAPQVGAGVAAWAAQRHRPTMAKRRRTDFMNGLTVHLPWGRSRGGGKQSAPESHSGSGVPAINALAKGNRPASKGKEMAFVL